MRIGASSLLLAALVPFSGCDSGSAPSMGATVPVKGKVTYKGQPITQGRMTFEPDRGGREAFGDIGPDGTFELSTFKAGDGALPGLHRVAVSGTGKGGKEVVPPKYRSVSSSKTEVEVSAGKADYVVEFK